MAKKAKKAKKAGNVRSRHLSLAAHPGTTAMLARVGGCNKPPIMWRKDGDFWEEAFLKSDCTYGNWQQVDESEVPESVRNGGA